MPKALDAPHVERLFPGNADALWLASDHFGHLAVFTSAGQGPLPIAALKRQCDLNIEIELDRLLEFTEAHQLGHAKTFLNWGRRGLFVFAWSGIRRSYERAVSPVAPITADNLPGHLMAIAKSTVFHALGFDEVQSLDVLQHFPCAPSVP